MLLGEYEHTIDDKNRLTLPAKFRRAFEDGIVVTAASVMAAANHPFDRTERNIRALSSS